MMVMMKSSTSAAVVLCFTILVGMTSPGCMTIMRLPEFPEPPQIYGGVRFNISSWGDSLHGSRAMVVALMIMDFPFSFVLDTALLPLTIPGEIYALANPRTETKPSTYVPADYRDG